VVVPFTLLLYLKHARHSPIAQSKTTAYDLVDAIREGVLR
jgi:hypothetical protein